MNAILPWFMAAGAVPLALPSLGPAAATDGAADDAIATGSYDWIAGQQLVILCGGRDGTTSTHNAPTIAGATMTTATQRAVAEANLGGVYVGGSIWTSRILTSGSGAVTWTTGDAQNQKILEVLIVPGATTFEYKAEGQNATGTGVSPTYDDTPNAAALSIVWMLQDGTGGTGYAVADHSAIADTAATISVLKAGAFAKLGSVAQTVVATGMESTKPHVLLGVTLL